MVVLPVEVIVTQCLDSFEWLEHPKKQELLVAMPGNYVPIGRREGKSCVG
ncbi:MAG: hypothetical protein KME57_05870 [Scytonema hyalinum WJT4-NPBG1]|jgi:hypothetical protein|nr:hypothetical protein [Scytonema hyalinum WJT4-NPBG1]